MHSICSYTFAAAIISLNLFSLASFSYLLLSIGPTHVHAAPKFRGITPTHIYACFSSLNSTACMRRPMALFRCTRQAHLLSFLLLSSICCSTKGRPILKLQETSKDVEEMLTVGMPMIGSRPPYCHGRCLSCGPCEAIQVPAVPQEEEKSGTRLFSSAIISKSGAGDGSTIYKPLSWKCKCGRVILNP